MRLTRWFRCWVTLSLAASLVVSSLAAAPASARGLQGERGATSAATRKAILAVVCEGKVVKSTCQSCPSFSGERSDISSIKVGPFHVGSFVTPGASEAYVSLAGCDNKPAGFGGGVLLRRTKRVWKVVRYDSGVDLRTCLRFSYKTGTTLLACQISGGGAGGVFAEGVVANYTGPTKSNFLPLIVVQDTSGACFETKDVVSLVGWSQRDVNSDGRLDLVLKITESHAKAKANDPCQSEEPRKVITHTISFLFNGIKFSPEAGAVATVKCLNNDTLGSDTNTDYCPFVK